jgi:hypothetical protein
MDARLLKLCQRHRNGARYWAVPGYRNKISLLPPSGQDTMAWGWTLRWPGRDAKGEYVRGVDLDRHLKLAKQEIRRLLANVKFEKCDRLTKTARKQGMEATANLYDSKQPS